jgi:hypothetical protein
MKVVRLYPFKSGRKAVPNLFPASMRAEKTRLATHNHELEGAPEPSNSRDFFLDPGIPCDYNIHVRILMWTTGGIGSSRTALEAK